MPSSHRSSSSTCPSYGLGPTTRIVLYVLLVVSFVLLTFIAFKVLDTSTRARGGGDGRESFASLEEEGYTVVYLYMDGCVHCQRFHSTWNEFAREMGSSPRHAQVRVQKYEADSAQAQGFSVQGYPTVLLTRGDRVVATFEEQRTVQALTSFVERYTQA